MSTILAIDPGDIQSAWVLYHPVAQTIVAKGKDDNSYVIETVLARFLIGKVVCEDIASYGMPVGREVFDTVKWIGEFRRSCKNRGQEFHEIFRRETKLHLCNSVKAKDGNVRQALIDKFGPPGTKKNPGKTYGCSADIWQALAVAVTFAETKMERL